MIHHKLLNRLSAMLVLAAAVTFSAQAQLNLGPVKIGSASAVTTATVSVTTAGTVGTIAVLTQGAPSMDYAVASGGTCAVATAYSAGTTCTVNLTFAPLFSGLRSGAVVLTDSTGAIVLGTTYLAGTGIGAQVSSPVPPAVAPATLNITVGDQALDPDGIAIDGNGNIYFADEQWTRYIYKLTPTGGGNYTSTTVSNYVTEGTNNPVAVALDGAGNVYGAFGTNPPLVEVYRLLPSGSYAPAVPIGTYGAGSFVGGVAVDIVGNVYITDNGAGSIYKETLSNGTYTQSVVASGLASPWSTAVDISGNVYTTLNGPGAVIKLTPPAVAGNPYTQTSIGSGWGFVNDVKLDGNGNVFVVNGPSITKLALQANGSYVQTDILTNIFGGPIAVAVDASGNVFTSGSDGSRNGWIYEQINSVPQSLTFANTAVGGTSSDSPQTVTLENIGNTPLVFADIAYPVDFPERLGVLGDCPIGTPLAPSATCTLSINFQPSVSGLIADNLYISDNAMNMQYAQQTIALNGTGTGTTRANAWWNPSAQITYGADLSHVLNATASVPGTFVYQTYGGIPITTSTIMPAGNTTLQVTFMPQSEGPSIHRSLVLTVLPAPLLVTPTSTTVTYMSQVPTYAYTLSGFVNGDTQAAVTGTPTINANATAPVRAGYIRGQVFITAPAGTYPLKSAWGSLKSSNYTFQFGTGTLTIVPATTPLTITARNVTVAKGAKFPTSLSYTMTGMLGMDSASTAGTGAPSITTTATAQSAPGTYTITASAGTFAAPNYSGVNYANGTLTIK